MSQMLDPQLQKTMNALLATEATLYFKTKKAHWLMMGPNFKELHELLDTHAQFILNSIDEIAERITMLRGLPIGSLTEFREHTLTKDFAAGPSKVQNYLQTLLEDHDHLVNAIKEGITQSGDKNDPGTQDLLTRLLQEHEKAAWFLRETVEAK